jgi:menaquinone-dependent protoporphyrinogen oxidase
VTKPRALVVFHSIEGQTAKIAHRLADALRSRGATVDVCDAETAPPPDAFDIVVVGDSIHAHHHSSALARYIKEHVQALNIAPSALFQVSLTSANPDQTHTDTANEMLLTLLDRTGFAPDLTALFAGALEYSKYGWVKRRLMRHIVRHEGGDTDMSRDYEYTDWGAVDRFAGEILSLYAELVHGASPRADLRLRPTDPRERHSRLTARETIGAEGRQKSG